MNDVRIVREMPKQKPGKSKQDYMTPDAFMEAISHRFGTPSIDLAAHEENHRCPTYITEETDSLKQDWDELGHEIAFLNPPFGLIEPWAKKCAAASKLKILFLVPASVGSNWWAEHVDRKGHVFFLRPRLSFDGKNPYPKDCALVVYNEGPHPIPERPRGSQPPNYECWKWA